MYANISRLVQNYAISVRLILGVRIQAANSCVTLWAKKGEPVLLLCGKIQQTERHTLNTPDHENCRS